VSVLAAAACTRPAGPEGAWPDAEGGSSGSSGSSGGVVDSGAAALDVSDTGSTSANVDTGAEPVLDIGPKPDGAACGASSLCQKDHPATPYCHSGHQVCVQCLVDFHCQQAHPQKPACIGGTCQQIACKPGAKSCKGNWLQTCNADGDGYDLDACPDAKPVCHQAACRVCKPGTVYCKAPDIDGKSTSVMQCNAAGSAATVAKKCPGKQVCNAGQCSACTPGARRCSVAIAQVCKPDGTGWITSQDCDAKGLACLGGLCVTPCSGDFKSNTHVGCDYWAVDLDNVKATFGANHFDAQNKQFAVVITNTSDQPAQVTVKLMSTTPPKSKTLTVPAKALRSIKLPNVVGAKTAMSNQDGSGINARVYNIKATQPIVAYQFNPLDNVGVFSNDASLLLPVSALGKSYYVMSGQQMGPNQRSYLTAIAVDPGTTKITVTVAADTIAGDQVPAMKAGQTKTFSLKQGQVLNIETKNNQTDLTGSRVDADKRIAVFGGSEASASPKSGNCVPNPKTKQNVCAGTSNFGSGVSCKSATECPNSCCTDHLEEQLFPTKIWGTTYVAAHLFRRGIEMDTWRIIAKDANTKLTFEPDIGVTPPTLGAGKWFEFKSNMDFVIKATGPVMVAQYMATSHSTITAEAPLCYSDDDCKTKHGFLARCLQWGLDKTCRPIGDPALLLGIATSQYLDDSIFLVPDKYKLNYVTIIAPTATQVKLDGTAIPTSTFKPITTTGYMVARLAIKAGSHRVTANKKVGVWVYGFDLDVSYGYVAGAKL